jgi:hypothetical protein
MHTNIKQLAITNADDRIAIKIKEIANEWN